MSEGDAKDTSEQTAGATVRRELGVALFFLVWASVGWVSLATAPNLFDSSRFGRLDPGPGLMPAAVLTIVTAGALALAVKPVIALLSKGNRRGRRIDLPWRTLAFFATVALFAPAMQTFGYILTTLAFVFGWSLALDREVSIRPLFALLRAVIAAVVTTLVIHVGFDRVIGAQLT